MKTSLLSMVLISIALSGCASNATIKNNPTQSVSTISDPTSSDLAPANKAYTNSVATTPTYTVKENTYIVKSGDTLSGIAAKQVITFKGYLKCLESVNKLTDKNTISIGQKLIIPNADYCKSTGLH